ncbi:MAG: GcrA family cell cycle regulator [Beijerinckiaceae bacterium]
MSWTDERIDLLKKLWTDGLSASQIAAELGMVTRNAVIGKVHRLGLAGRAKAPAVSAARPPRKPVSTGSVRVAGHNGGGMNGAMAGGLGGGMGRSINAGQTRGATALKITPQPQEEVQTWVEPLDEDVVVPMSQRVTIMELKEGLCKWPMGDPTQDAFRYCGANCDIGTPYCTYHARVAYQPPSDRRRHDRRVMSRI